MNIAEALNPDERDQVMEEFKVNHWSMFGDAWDVLGREIEFVQWMQNSGRLARAEKDNWYDTADAYLLASRFA